LIVLVSVVAVRSWQSANRPRSPELLPEGVYDVERVVDGDTLLLTNGARVRLQGIDAPESVKPEHPVEPWGPEASAFAKELLAEGKVRLQFDRQRKDQHGRFLAYVWSGDRMLNEALVRAGLARFEAGYRYSQTMKRRLRRAEDEAKAARRGIWSGRDGSL
jgi:micrococcal nuclease